MKPGTFVPAVAGVPPGYFVGHIYDGKEPVWEVIKHAAMNFTVRQPGKDENTGIVINVPSRLAVRIFNKLGIYRIKGQRPPWPDTPVTWRQRDRRIVVVKIGEFVDAAWELLENTVGAKGS